MRRKTIWSAIFIFAMILGVSGCQKKETTEGGTSNKEIKEGTTEEGKDGTSEAADKEEPVTLTMFIRNQSKYTGLQSDPVAKYVEEKLGVRIDLKVDSSLGNTSAQNSSYNELLAANLATGELADIIDFGDSTGNAEVVNNLKRAAESGLIIPLDELVELNTTNISKDPRLTVRNEYRKNIMYGDGHFYSLGAWGGMGLDQLPYSANWVRWDIYKEMGYPEVNTDEEFLELIRQMTERYPQTPAGEKIYGFGGGFADPKGIGDGFIVREYPLSKGYEPLEGNYAVYLDYANRSVTAPLADPDSFFWKGVEFYYKANQMGLIDPGAMTMTNAEYEEKFKKGGYMATLNGWATKDKEAQLEALGMKGAGYMPTKMLKDVKSFTLYWESVLGGCEFTISKECKYPEKAIKFLDWCFSEEGSRIITQGAEGLAWEMEDGVPTVTEQYLKDNAEGTVDMAEAYGKWKYAGINAFQHIDQDSQGYYIQPDQIPNEDAYSAVKKDALAYYGADSFSDYFTNYTKENGEKLPNIVWGSYAGAIGEKPDDIKQKYSQINDYMYQTVFKLIYAKDDAEYNSLKKQTIEELQNMGLSDVVDWYTKRFKEIKEILDPMIDSSVKAYLQK